MTGIPAAVLWDMDGLLVDTEPLWTVAEHELAARCGSLFTAEAKAAIVGTRLQTAVPLLLQRFGVEATSERVEREAGWLLGRMVELFGDGVPAMPGAVDLHRRLRALGVPQALVSSSYRVLVDAVLALGFGPFDATVAGDEVRQGKPLPEPYLRAAALLGVPPERCVVLEDSPSGVQAGLAAGCGVVAVPSVPGVVLHPSSRCLVVDSLAAVRDDGLAAVLT